MYSNEAVNMSTADVGSTLLCLFDGLPSGAMIISSDYEEIACFSSLFFFFPSS